MLVKVNVFGDSDCSAKFVLEVDEVEGRLLREFVETGTADPSIEGMLLASRYPTIEDLDLGDLSPHHRDMLVGALLYERFETLVPVLTVSYSLK